MNSLKMLEKSAEPLNSSLENVEFLPQRLEDAELKASSPQMCPDKQHLAVS